MDLNPGTGLHCALKEAAAYRSLVKLTRRRNTLMGSSHLSDRKLIEASAWITIYTPPASKPRQGSSHLLLSLASNMVNEKNDLVSTLTLNMAPFLHHQHTFVVSQSRWVTMAFRV